MMRKDDRDKMDSMELALLTLKEASDLLSCHPNTLRKWDKDGILKAVRIGTRKDRRYRKGDILRLFNKVSYVKDSKEVKNVSAVRKEYFMEYANLLAERANLQRDSICVDVPCGAGELVKTLTESGFGRKYYLIDINSEMIEAARQNAPVESVFIVGDAGDIAGMVHEKVDAVFCLNGFHVYIDRKRDFLKGCYEVLKPGGVLIFDISTKGIGDKESKKFLSIEAKEFKHLAHENGIQHKRPEWPNEELLNTYRQMAIKEGFAVDKTISIDTWIPIEKPIDETLKIPGRLRAWLPGISDTQRVEIYKQANEVAKKQTDIKTIKHNRIFFIATKNYKYHD